MQITKRMTYKSLISLFLILLLAVFWGCSDDSNDDDDAEDSSVTSSRAYKGHENDVDIANLCKVYPSIVGTRLDDCQTCHTGKMEDRVLASNACDHCHNLMLEESGHTFMETLNPYGVDYWNAGRSIPAIKDIKNVDSDGDGYENDEEIMKLRYPGSSQSQPGQKTAPLLIVSLDEIKGMTSHSQFMLANASRQQFDTYVSYKGVKIKELFEELGIDLTGATGITVIAPDGFMKSLPIEQVDMVFPQPMFYSGLGTDVLGPDCGFVEYPEEIPEGVSDGEPIPGEHWLMMAYERDGMPLDSSYLDVASGKIRGEGPLRLVVPQTNPGPPDRGAKYSPSGCNDGYDFNEDVDHNAGMMVRGVIAIRIDPMPEGVEEFDYMNGGWAYIDSKELIIYGHNIK